MTIFKKNPRVFAGDLCQNSANGMEAFAFIGYDMERKYENLCRLRNVHPAIGAFDREFESDEQGRKEVS
jgi:hypothetical protein